MARAPPLLLLLLSVIALTRVRLAACQGTNFTVSSDCSTAYSLLPPGYDIAQNFDTVVDLQRSAGVVAARTADQCCAQCTLSKLCGAWVFASNGCTVKAGTVSNLQSATVSDCSICTRGGIRIVPGQANNTGSNAPALAPAPALATSAGAAIPGYDLYGEVKSYSAGPYNVTTQASSIWVAVNYTSGAAWNVTLPYFARILGGTGTTGGDFGSETVYPGSGSDGCLTVNVTSNTTSTVTVLLYDKSAAVPFSVCNGTCSKTTPLATGVEYSFALNNSARNSINATMKYVAYPSNHPVCVVALYSLPVSNALSMYTTNQTKSMPPSGLALDLGTGHTLQPGAFSILAAFSNSTCLRFSPTDTGNVTSVTVSLFSEGSLGFALRRGVNNNLTGSVNSSNRCSFGTDRDSSVPNCDVANGNAAFVKSMNPAIRYFLVAQNTGALRASFTMLKNPYSADSCQLNQVNFGEFRTVTTQTVTNAQQETAAQAATVLQAISRAIDANADHL